MDEIMKDLEIAYKSTASIPVTGNPVDELAVVRSRLRKAYAELEKLNADKKVAQDE